MIFSFLKRLFRKRRKTIIEKVYDQFEKFLWSEPYLFRCLNVPGSYFIKDYVTYHVVSSTFLEDAGIVKTVVRVGECRRPK